MLFNGANNWKPTGFTLIELLVVITIIVLLASMSMTLYKVTPDDQILSSSFELQSVLARARSLAMSTGKDHAVAFHIENAGDGTVLKNFSSKDDGDFKGRHWYCIIGPDYSNLEHRRTTGMPEAYELWSGWEYSFFNLQRYVETMELVQVGARHYLKPGVRFLALSDVDNLYRHSQSGYQSDTYPRPWFGYYDDNTGTLYPWGSYNRELDQIFQHPNTGLDYEGEDGVIPYDPEMDTNINPPEVWGRVHDEATAMYSEYVTDAGEDKSYLRLHNYVKNFTGPDTSYLASTATDKKPRPLVNAHWGDFMIIFNALGSASVGDPRARMTYFRSTGINNAHVQTRNRGADNLGRDRMELAHSASETGGFYITLCRDVDEDSELYEQTSSVTGAAAYNKFTTVEDAYRSLFPLRRIFVSSATGNVDIRGTEHPEVKFKAEDLLLHEPYPNGH